MWNPIFLIPHLELSSPHLQWVQTNQNRTSLLKLTEPLLLLNTIITTIPYLPSVRENQQPVQMKWKYSRFHEYFSFQIYSSFLLSFSSIEQPVFLCHSLPISWDFLSSSPPPLPSTSDLTNLATVHVSKNCWPYQVRIPYMCPCHIVSTRCAWGEF